MTQREKVLSTIVGGTVLVLVNLFLLNFFMKNQGTLRQDLAAKQSLLQGMQTLHAESGLWESRAAWLQAKQPKLENTANPSVPLQEELKALAKKYNVLPVSVSLGSADPRPHCTSVSVTFNTKSTWKALINFLSELQGPEKFMVLETATLRKDSADETQMTAELRIAKWYAPK